MPRALVWNQDPSIPVSGIRLVHLPNKISSGPRDDQIEILGMNPVTGNQDGDFIIDPRSQPEDFDAVHTFVVVRQLVTVYQRALRRIGRDKPLNWQWGHRTPLKVYPWAGHQTNAFYSRQGQCLKFFYFSRNRKTIYTSRSMEVVTHECGHAILDALRPGYWGSWQPETAALHESFADISVLLALLAQLDQCQSIIIQSRSNLHDKSFFSAIAEDHNEAFGRAQRGLRSADNTLTMLEIPDEVRDKSLVFTGAFYDILADIFEEKRDPNLHDDAEILHQVGQHMAELLLEALLRGPPQNATFRDIADKMVALEKNSKWRAFIRDRFTRRLVLGKDKVKAPTRPVDIGWSNCHCCMSKREHLKAVERGIKYGQSCVRFKPKS